MQIEKKAGVKLRILWRRPRTKAPRVALSRCSCSRCARRAHGLSVVAAVLLLCCWAGGESSLLLLVLRLGACAVSADDETDDNVFVARPASTCASRSNRSACAVSLTACCFSSDIATCLFWFEKQARSSHRACFVDDSHDISDARLNFSTFSDGVSSGCPVRSAGAAPSSCSFDGQLKPTQDICYAEQPGRS